jgi:hypothetical protein
VIAQAIIDAHCRRLDPAMAEILRALEKHLPDGVRLVQTGGNNPAPSGTVCGDPARQVSSRRP